ncbi:S41 family peptidase [Longispora sp. K20-0274]|uniref:S41 family peptidase n=1 Tax=Longispora sp. K20-0274 TaxID=3088255 RepID=UPI003999564D
MQREEIIRIVEESAALVAGNYVFPEIGATLGTLLETRLAAGVYLGAGDARALGTQVTVDLQSVNGDKHLRLKYHEEEIPDLPPEEMMTAEVLREAARTLGGIARIERLPGNVALLELGPRLLPAAYVGDAVAAAMTVVARADALVLDLRGTVGGDPGIVALICSYLVGDEPVHLNNVFEAATGDTTQFWTLPYVPGAKFGPDKPVWVLTSSATFSGGEELAYDLQQLGRATLVGERTGGGAHPRIGIRVHAHLELTVPTGRGINPVSGTNWEGVGVAPDIECPAGEALEVALRANAGEVPALRAA